METAKKLNYDHSVVTSENTEEIRFKTDVQGCLLRAQYTGSKYDRSVVHIIATVSSDIKAGDLEVSLNRISPIHFVEQSPIEDNRLNLHEYGNTSPHSMSVGGDSKMHAYEIADKFYNDENVESIYVYAEDQDVDLFLVLTDEVDLMSLRLAKLQRSIAKQYPDYSIEIIYTTKNLFTNEHIHDGAELYPRRK